jgi:zinc transporter ZupT
VFFLYPMESCKIHERKRSQILIFALFSYYHQTNLRMTIQSENVGAAFGLVIAAAASTGLGAAVVFVPSMVKLAKRSVLAASLGFSAGVMTFVSFSEIFYKSLASFEEGGVETDRAFVYASVGFFVGVVVVMVRGCMPKETMLKEC